MVPPMTLVDSISGERLIATVPAPYLVMPFGKRVDPNTIVEEIASARTCLGDAGILLLDEPQVFAVEGVMFFGDWSDLAQSGAKAPLLPHQ
jgi:hypothetical protein